MEAPKVSVCLPTWNSAKFLPETLRCLGRQTFRDWELVAVDSFSSDGTWELLQGVSTPERRTLFQRPRGLYQAWNACIEASSGKWIYFATSDDWLSDDCLEAFVGCALEQPEAELIASKSLVLDETGKVLDSATGNLAAWLYGRDDRRTGWANRRSELLFGILAGTPVTSVNQLLIRRDLFDRLGMFPTDLGSFGDFYWQMRTIGKARLYRIGRALAGWRRHASQATPGNVEELHRRRAEMCVRLLEDGCFGADGELMYSVGLLAGYYGAANLPAPSAPQISGVKAGRALRGLGPIGRILIAPRMSRILVSVLGRKAEKST